MQNKDYRAGDNPLELDDYYVIFGRDGQYTILFSILTIMWMVANWIVFARNRKHISIAWTVIMLVLLWSYFLVLRSHNRTLIEVFNEVYKLFIAAMITVYTMNLFRRA